MRVYTIADKIHVTYGTNDVGIERHIIKQGSRGSGDFPMLYTDEADALAAVNFLSDKTRKVVVNLGLQLGEQLRTATWAIMGNPVLEDEAVGTPEEIAEKYERNQVILAEHARILEILRLHL